MEITAEPFAKGYRLVARIPFTSFCQGPIPPKIFAIDFAIDSADQRGGRIGQYVFAGMPTSHKDARWLHNARTVTQIGTKAATPTGNHVAAFQKSPTRLRGLSR